LRFLVAWQDHADNAAREERATVADLRIFLSEQNVTLHLESQASADHITIALYGLAEGLAHDWWRIFGARDRAVSLMDYRTGYAVPDLRMSFDGVIFQVEAHQRTYRNPDIRFWAGPTEIMNRLEAEAQLGGFVDKILSRLNESDIRTSNAAARWARVQASRNDAEEAAFCEAAGALGLDPYQIDDRAAHSIENASTLFEGEPLTEFLAGAQGVDESRLLEWVEAVEKRPRYQARIAELRDIVVQVAQSAVAKPAEASWSLGYRRARALRRALNLQIGKRFSSYRSLAERLGANKSYKLAASVDGIRALRSDHEDGVYLHMRMHGPSANARDSQLFSFTRAVGDVVCFPDEGRAPINGLNAAYRQAAGRALAAEFLAPIDEIRSMRESGRDVVSMAEELHVSTTLIERQLENASRIDEACA